MSTLSSARSTRLRFVPTTVLFAAALLVCALPASAGMYYEATTTVDQGQGSNTVKGWVQGEASRIEFVDSDIPTVSSGAYMVTEDGGQTIYMVDPKEKTYARYDFATMLSMLESTGGMVELDFGTPQVEILEERDGEAMLGYDTQYVRSRSLYDMTMRVFGMKRSMKTESIQEMWMAEDLEEPGFFAWLRKSGRTTGDSGLDEMIAAEMEKLKGVPLKTVTVSTSEGQKGRENTTRTVTEVTKLEEQSGMDASMFRVPAGYKEVSMIPGAEGGEDGGNPLKGLFGGG